MACCPAHDDSTASLHVSMGQSDDWLLHCHAGCTTGSVMEEAGLTWDDLRKPSPNAGNANKPMPPSVASLASRKRLPEKWLQTLGCKTISQGVEIYYADAKNNPARPRRRTLNGSGQETFKWYGRKSQEQLVYGLWLPANITSTTLTLVEGESDCWTLWHHDIPALGIPGANMCHLLKTPDIAHTRTLYIVREPGRSGDTFIPNVEQRLLDLGYAGKPFVIDFTNVEGGDPSGLHIASPDAFKARWSALVESATPLEQAKTRDPRVWHRNDTGMALRFLETYEADYRFVTRWNEWLRWDGVRWVRDDECAIHEAASHVVDLAGKEADALPDDERKRYKAFCLTCGNQNKLRAQVDRAKSLPPFPMPPDAFEQRPMLLTCANGTLDLEKGVLRLFDREDYLTHASPVAYDKKAKAPRFMQFLDETFGSDGDLISYMQRAAGYCLSGLTSEQCMFLLLGSGANGKSVWLNVLFHVLGDYAGVMQQQALLNTSSDAGTMDAIANLKGKRFAQASETEIGAHLSEALIKTVTGGERIRTKFMRQKTFEYLPTWKLWLATNHTPTLKGTDNGIWRRMKLIRFRYTPEVLDKDLFKKLKAEAPGILNWMLEGCLLWQKEGLSEPSLIKQWSKDYRASMDPLSAWLDDHTGVIKGDATGSASMTLYRDYRGFTEALGERPMSHRAWAQVLDEKGFKRGRTNTARHYEGLYLMDEMPADKRALLDKTKTDTAPF